MSAERTPRQIIGDDAYMQLVFEGYEVVKAAALASSQEEIERLRKALETKNTVQTLERVKRALDALNKRLDRFNSARALPPSEEQATDSKAGKQ